MQKIAFKKRAPRAVRVVGAPSGPALRLLFVGRF